MSNYKFRNWDNSAKYLRSDYQKAVARIGHIEKAVDDAVQQAVDIFNSVIMPVTLQDVQDLINNAQLQPNIYYQLDGVNGGENTIYLQSTSPSTLSTKGVGKFYNPKYDYSKPYDGLNIERMFGGGLVPFTNYWNPVEGERYVYGNKMWIYLGWINAYSQPIDEFEPVDFSTGYSPWVDVSVNEIEYDVVYDEIEYDHEHDLIVYRRDKDNNSVRINYEYLVSLVGAPNIHTSKNNPLKMWQWGRKGNYNNTVEFSSVCNMNSVVKFQNNKFINGSVFYQNLLFDEHGGSVDSIFSGNLLDNSKITNVYGKQFSIFNNQIYGSEIKDICPNYGWFNFNVSGNIHSNYINSTTIASTTLNTNMADQFVSIINNHFNLVTLDNCPSLRVEWSTLGECYLRGIQDGIFQSSHASGGVYVDLTSYSGQITSATFITNSSFEPAYITYDASFAPVVTTLTPL